jgi:hypothetical protein
MLTEQQVRDLLHHAADTVDVTPGIAPAERRRRWWPLAAVAASVALVIGVGSVVQQLATDGADRSDPVSGGGPTGAPSKLPDGAGQRTCAGSQSGQQELPTPPPGPDYPTNASGLTYGSSQTGKDPDLVAVIGNCGRGGYVFSNQLFDPTPWDPQAGSEAGSRRTIPVYEPDGTTQIDTFTIGGGRSDSSGGSSSAPPAGPDADAIQGDWSVTIAGVTNQDGSSQYDTFRDLALTATVSGSVLRVNDGCTDSSAQYQLIGGEFSLTAPFTADDPGPPCTTRHAPLTDILENIRHVTTHAREVYLALDNHQIVLILRPE